MRSASRSIAAAERDCRVVNSIGAQEFPKAATHAAKR
jgi:hypothetical protein